MQHEAARAPDDVGHAGLVAQRGAVKPAVEPAEEAVLRMHVIPAYGFQHRGAEGRGQHDGDHHRQHHGRNDGHRELPVDDAHGPAEEGHGDEHGGQHHGDADQSAGDLIHGFPGGLFGRELVLAHHALHVFNDDDGVVHEEADGEHHSEHGQRVDGITERRQHAERAEKHDGHRDGRDEGCAEVLEEQVHDQKHQKHGFAEGLHHFVDGNLHDRRGIKGIHGLQPLREEGFGALQIVVDIARRFQRVRAGGELHGDTRGGLAVIAAERGVAFAAKLHTGHVLHADERAVGVGAQDDVAELLRGLQALLHRNGEVHLLARHGRGAAELTGGNLRVLCVDRVDHVARHQLVALQLVRIEPDAGACRTGCRTAILRRRRRYG